MSFLPQILFPDFIKTLNSAREFYTRSQYFSYYKSFSTIYLLQKQGLNPRNYSVQE
jgi:hypothetical protein